ncbi:MAG TPA: AI-2E family transporter [Gemmatimonadales bacterium]|nr:AI-2E family transporter [Gemmatimonadales bacterium]
MQLDRAAHYAVIGLFFILAGWVVSRSPAIVNPILLAILLNYLFSPLVRRLRRRRVPGAVSATLFLVLLFTGVGAATVALARPAAAWIERIPESRDRLRELTREIQKRVRPVMEAATEVQEAAREMEGPRRRAQEVKVAEATLVKRIADHATTILGGAVMTFFLALLLLAPGDVFQQKLLKLFPAARTREQLQLMSDQVEQQVSRYLGSVVLINAGVGAVTGLAMWLTGLPNPALWGVVAGVLNFVPYLGAVATVAIIGLASLLTFDDLARAAVPPLVFLGLNLLEGNVVTPKLVERWLKLNAVASFLAVIILWALLGIPGALMAVPILVVVKVVCDHVESLKGIGTFLGA